MTRTAIKITLAAVVGLAAMPASGETRQAAVAYQPLELQSAAGVRDVIKRLRVSIKRACEAPSALLKRDQYRCERELQDQLVTKVGSPLLLALNRKPADATRLASHN